MDGTESEKNLFLCENIRASLRLYINSEILQIYRQQSRVVMNHKIQVQVPKQDLISAKVHVYFIDRKSRDKVFVIKLGNLELG